MQQPVLDLSAHQQHHWQHSQGAASWHGMAAAQGWRMGVAAMCMHSTQPVLPVPKHHMMIKRHAAQSVPTAAAQLAAVVAPAVLLIRCRATASVSNAA